MARSRVEWHVVSPRPACRDAPRNILSKKTPFQLVILSLPFVIRAINHYTINENARQPGAGCMEQ